MAIAEFNSRAFEPHGGGVAPTATIELQGAGNGFFVAQGATTTTSSEGVQPLGQQVSCRAKVEATARLMEATIKAAKECLSSAPDPSQGELTPLKEGHVVRPGGLRCLEASTKLGPMVTFMEASIKTLRGLLETAPQPGQATEAAAPPSLHQGPAAANPFLYMPKDLIEKIFYSLRMKHKQALGMTCTHLAACLQEHYRQRYQQLLAFDKESQLFGPFGIACLDGKAPNHAHMQRMVRRVKTILLSTNEALKNFSESALPSYRSEALVLRFHPKHLQSVLQTAYRCSLYKFFEQCGVRGLRSEASLEKAAQGLLAWLGSSKALNVVRLEAEYRPLSGKVCYLMARTPLKAQSLLPAQGGARVAPQDVQQEPDCELVEPAPRKRRAGKLGKCTVPIHCCPPALGCLKNLGNLELVNEPGITALPAAIGQLTNLQRLSLQLEGLERLPAEIGQLTNLRELELRASSLDQLPDEIGQLVNLVKLVVVQSPDVWGQKHRPGLRTLPPKICGLKKLTSLSLACPRLSQLPEEIWQLENLTTFSLGAKKLEFLPPGIWRLRKLESLSCTAIGLKEVTAEFGQVTTLKSLELAGNCIKSLPAALGQLTNLTSLNLFRNRLRSLPSSLACLGNLGNFQVRGNPLGEFAREVMRSEQHPLLANRAVAQELHAVAHDATDHMESDSSDSLTSSEGETDTSLQQCASLPLGS